MRRHPTARIMGRLPHRIPDGALDGAHGSLSDAAHSTAHESFLGNAPSVFRGSAYGVLPSSAPDGTPGVAHDGPPVSHRSLRHTYASLPGR